MKNKSRDGGARRTSLASDAIAAFMLLSVYQQDIKNSQISFSGVQASDLHSVHHGNSILNMYNENEGCIYNIGCLEAPTGHFVVSNHVVFDKTIINLGCISSSWKKQ